MEASRTASEVCAFLKTENIRKRKLVDIQVERTIEVFIIEEIEEEIEGAEKEEEIEMNFESGDERDYIRDCENCIGNETSRFALNLF